MSEKLTRERVTGNLMLGVSLWMRDKIEEIQVDPMYREIYNQKFKQVCNQFCNELTKKIDRVNKIVENGIDTKKVTKDQKVKAFNGMQEISMMLDEAVEKIIKLQSDEATDSKKG